jgi:hypothetical protein
MKKSLIICFFISICLVVCFGLDDTHFWNLDNLDGRKELKLNGTITLKEFELEVINICVKKRDPLITFFKKYFKHYKIRDRIKHINDEYLVTTFDIKNISPKEYFGELPYFHHILIKGKSGGLVGAILEENNKFEPLERDDYITLPSNSIIRVHFLTNVKYRYEIQGFTIGFRTESGLIRSRNSYKFGEFK